uniref:Uncharacterized protein n=1 Tax=Colobus angolensis palliatus TaxID=336983 RepID=A0A2K5JZ61_COLAP
MTVHSGPIGQSWLGTQHFNCHFISFGPHLQLPCSPASFPSSLFQSCQWGLRLLRSLAFQQTALAVYCPGRQGPCSSHAAPALGSG